LVTGDTVFDDLPLRFRNLTLDPPDLSEACRETPGAFKIRLARNRDRGASSLVAGRYLSRGYAAPVVTSDAALRTFVAFDEGALVGTLGIRLDSGAGLAAEAMYAEEVGALRETGARLCEFTRLAVNTHALSKPVLAALFHTAYLYAARVRGHTGAVIEVNPRHVAFYTRLLCFEPIGPERISPRVNAPARLLYVHFDRIARELTRHARDDNRQSPSHSLFAYGFPPDEAAGILRRLELLDARPRPDAR
jgi:hypothetical protein